VSASLSTKLLRMNLMVSGTALLLAVIAFFSYDLISYRHHLADTLQAEAAIAGQNVVGALTFDDAQSAHDTLQALCSSPDVYSGALVAKSGTIFTRFTCPGSPGKIEMPVLPADENSHVLWNGLHLTIGSRISFSGSSLGTVYVAGELHEIRRRAEQYLIIAFFILLLCMIAAFIIGATIRRTLAGPIISLAELSRRVSRDRDYSLRAAPARDRDEIATLINSFNEMLEQIQDRDSALSRARDELEVRVEDRTAELKAANRELEAFAYTVAHDLRGPLDAISMLAYLLQTQYANQLEQDGNEMLDRLRLSTRNMALLIDDLLHFSRATTTELRKTTVDLGPMASQIVDDLRLANPDRRVTFTMAEVPPVKADAALVRIVLDNLLRNAWKYTGRKEEARIDFGFLQKDGEVVYFVRDNGAGFDAARADMLFKPFQRLHSKGEFPGTGIGLATVYRILERHGGRIWAESKLGEGAAFYFTLPS
jgi:signal transduction histidine kinase